MNITGSKAARVSAYLGVAALAAFGLGGSAFAASLVGNSPFLPSGKGGSAAGATAEAYELAGSSRQGSSVTLCIFERQAKRTQWIGVGETVDGISVVSYDPASDTAWVSVNGAKKELSMRKGEVVAGSGTAGAAVSMVAASATPAPVSSASTESPAALAQDQREARMLVSDLLEIGVQQRKAYQDAKRKAASETSSQPTN